LSGECRLVIFFQKVLQLFSLCFILALVFNPSGWATLTTVNFNPSGWATLTTVNQANKLNDFSEVSFTEVGSLGNGYGIHQLAL